MHEPICLDLARGDLRLQVVFAYQSLEWGTTSGALSTTDALVEGGTHEEGLREALDRLYKHLELPRTAKASRNGVVGIMSLHYPAAVWEGCIKSRIGNPELRPLVRDLVVQGATEWVQARPALAVQLCRRLERFRFPDAWCG